MNSSFVVQLPEHVDAARPALLLVIYKHVALVLAKLVDVPGQFDIHLAIIDYLLAQSRISRPPPIHAGGAASALSATERGFGQSFEPDTEAQFLDQIRKHVGALAIEWVHRTVGAEDLEIEVLAIEGNNGVKLVCFPEQRRQVPLVPGAEAVLFIPRYDYRNLELIDGRPST